LRKESNMVLVFTAVVDTLPTLQITVVAPLAP
jgi:hypothetical protein